MKRTKPSDVAIVMDSIERHGGLDAFESISEIRLSIGSVTGPIPTMKGLGKTFEPFQEVSIRPHDHQAIFHGYAEDGGDLLFDNGALVSGTERHERFRRNFSGLRKLRRWTPQSAVYFFGYAMCNYFSLPFSLPRYETVAHGRSRHGRGWVLKRFPTDVDTHSPLQRFWFDETGLLVRHDYSANVLGPMMKGANYSRRYRSDFAVPIAEERVVKFRLHKLATPMTVLRAQFTVKSAT